jgi:hypothetical protein
VNVFQSFETCVEVDIKFLILGSFVVGEGTGVAHGVISIRTDWMSQSSA